MGSVRLLWKALPLLVLLAACSAAPTATASVVRLKSYKTTDRYEGSVLAAKVIVRAGRAERNRLSVTRRGESVVIADGARLRPGRGCRRRGRRAVGCGLRRFHSVDFRIFLGDRADSATFKNDLLDGSEGGEAVLRAGPGNDRVHAGDTNTDLYGGAGNDLLRSPYGIFVGGPGDDRMLGEGLFVAGRSPDGSDVMRGGGLVDYSARSGDIRADLAGDRDDGARGERDRIGRGSEDLWGGSGDDVLVGNARDNDLVPGSGADVAIGGAGSDDLLDEPPAPDDGADRLFGGPGGDEIAGGPGPDTIAGGPGWDTAVGGPGDDRLDVRDGRRDDVACGEGADTVTLDGFDYFSSLFGTCEAAERNAPAGALFINPSDESLLSTPYGSPTVPARIGCPGDAPPTCEGRVRLDISGRTRDPVAFSIARDQTQDVQLALDQQEVERAKHKVLPAVLAVETVQPGGGVSSVVYRVGVGTYSG